MTYVYLYVCFIYLGVLISIFSLFDCIYLCMCCAFGCSYIYALFMYVDLYLCVIYLDVCEFMF